MLHRTQHQRLHRPCSTHRKGAVQKLRCSVRAQASDYDRLEGIEDSLASEFSAHINELCLKAPLQHRRPSPLDPPTAAVAAQLDALQINDWPEPDAGVYTAMAFAKPYECEQLLAVAPQHRNDPEAFITLQQSGTSSASGTSSVSQQQKSENSSSKIDLETGIRVRSWAAQEQWLTPQQFMQQLHSPPYDVLLGFDSWRASSNMVFPATRVGHRAVQAVEILAPPKQHASSSESSSSNSSSGRDSSVMQSLQTYTFTFLLELIGTGPYKGCWMTVGVRPGNYSV